MPIEQLKAARVPGRFISLLTSMLAIEPAARPAGASELTAKLQAIRNSITGRSEVIARLAIGAALVAFAIVAAIWNSHRQSTATVVPTPEKSIAVLPFENFSDDKENAYFADGVQDEILTDLTKVADLKVISRRSVAQYRDTKQTIRQIGQALGVAHVLAGTVRKAAGRIHVTVQLIDAHNEAETWAEKYDRDVADVFLIQSDISQEIVSRLKAVLSPEEKAAIEEKPTQDKEAYDLYLRARALVYGQEVTLSYRTAEENNAKAIKLLESAIARDPKFTLAYCVLAEAHLFLEAPDKAKEAVDAALGISPDSAEAHLVRARYFSVGMHDVSAAEKELALAAAALPGRVDVFNLRAEVEERRGQWKKALHDRERAHELDPQNLDTTHDLGYLNIVLRKYEEAERLCDHIIATVPEQSTDMFWRLKGFIALARGDAKAAMAALDSRPDRNDGFYNENHLVAHVFLMQHNYQQAEQIVQSAEETAKKQNVWAKVQEQHQPFGRGVAMEKLGKMARFRGEQEKARGYFEAARSKFEEWLAENPGHGSSLLAWFESHAPAYIAEIDAALGRKDDAIREGRDVAKLWPLERDALIAPNIQIILAVVYMWSGERDAALEQLMETAKLPVQPPGIAFFPGLSAGELKLNPLWDDLRNDPRFDKIVAEAAKPVKLD